MKMKLKRYAALLMVVMISVVSVAGCGISYDERKTVQGPIDTDIDENANYIIGKSEDYKFYDDRAYVEFEKVMPIETVMVEDIDPTIILWLNATYAVQTKIQDYDPSVISGTKDSLNRYVGVLKNGWGIDDRDSFIEKYNKLITHGHRGTYLEYVNEMILDGVMDQYTANSRKFFSIIKEHYPNDDDSVIARRLYAANCYLSEGPHFLDAWDYSRAEYILSCAYVSGMITFDEYMEHSVPLANLIKETYSGWDQVWARYVDGYQYWAGSNPITDSEYKLRKKAYKKLIANREMLATIPYEYRITFDKEAIYAKQDQAREEMDRDSGFSKNGYVCNAEPNVFYDYDLDIDGKSIPAKIMFSAIKPDRDYMDSREIKTLLLTIVVNGDGPDEEAIRGRIVLADYYNADFSYDMDGEQELKKWGSKTLYWDNSDGTWDKFTLFVERLNVVDGRTADATVYMYSVAVNTPKGNENAVIGFIPGFKYPDSDNQDSFADYYRDDGLLLRLSNDTIIRGSLNPIEVGPDLSYTILKGIKADFSDFVRYYRSTMDILSEKKMKDHPEDDAYNWTFLMYNPKQIKKFDENPEIRDKIMKDLLAERLILPDSTDIPLLTEEGITGA